jgi:hypothetical protein
LINVYLDASALVKRYRQEIGSEVVNDTIDRVSADDSRRLFISSLTTIETLSILNRRRHESHMPLADFIVSLRGVIGELKRFSHYLAIDDQLIISSAQYTIKHNINSAGAIHMAILLSLHNVVRQGDDDLLCWAADKRLVRAVRAEGIPVIDPEEARSPIL